MSKKTLFGCESILPNYLKQIAKSCDDYIIDEITGAIKFRMPLVEIDHDKLEKWVNMCIHLDNIDKESQDELGLRMKIDDLQHQLKVSEKATILACGEINKCPYEFCPNDIDGNKLVSKVYGSVCAKCHYDYFKQLAEKEVEND